MMLRNFSTMEAPEVHILIQQSWQLFGTFTFKDEVMSTILGQLLALLAKTQTRLARSETLELLFLNESVACMRYFLSCFPRRIHFYNCGSGGGEEPGGAKGLRLIQIRVATPSREKVTPASQDNSPQTRIADSSSTNAVNFSSARSGPLSKL
jgi:hypothetical protein